MIDKRPDNLCPHFVDTSLGYCITCHLRTVEKENEKMKTLIKQIALENSSHIPLIDNKCNCVVCQCREYLKQS